MISTRWLERRRSYWNSLEDLLDRSSRRGLNCLTRTELQELSLLYRQTAADLATIREDRGSFHFANYLNQLLARAHHTIYSGRKTRPKALFEFFRTDYPQVFRNNLNYFLAAVLIFLMSAGTGAVLTYRDPDFKVKVLGPGMVETIEHKQMWTHSIVAVKPLASSAIMTNNISVAFLTFAAGITAGIGTIYMMIFNGLMLGVIATSCWSAGMSLQLWSFVAPHGVLELPAIFIAAGAGLRLASGLLFPGVLPREMSLSQAGTQAVKLLLGCIPMLVLAGIIEAFVSPTGLSVSLKFAMGAGLFTLLFVYLVSSAPKSTTTVRVPLLASTS